jgi:hypothetical protein
VRDLLVGLILFLLLALPNFFNTPRDNDFSLSPPYLGRSLFGALFLIFGLLMGGSEMLLHRYLSRKSLSASAAAQQGVPSLKSRLFYTLVISVMTGLLVVGIWHITALFGTPSSAAAITMTFTGIAIGLGCFYAAGFITGIVTKVRWMGLLTGTLAGVLFGAVDSLSTPGNLLEAGVVYTFMMTIFAALFSLLGAWLATRKRL